MTENLALPPFVDGHTRLYAIVGDPIVQTLSPQTFTPLFRAAEWNAVLIPLNVPADRFEAAMRGLMSVRNFYGSMVTYPFKAAAMSLVDRVLDTGKQIGAINTMRREPDGSWTGEIFDGRGLVRGLKDEGFDLAGRRILLLGAGGAGSALAFAFAHAGACVVTIFDLDTRRAGDLALRVAAAVPACDARTGGPLAAGHDFLVNATPVGMSPGDGLPAEIGALDPSMVVVDIVPKHDVLLLRQARAQGCRTVDFRVMLQGQVKEICNFFGVP